jgi:hypothetical protein
MSFFAKLKADAEAVEAKIKSLITVEGPKIEDEIRTETTALFKQLLAYLEARLNGAGEVEAAIAGAANKLLPGIGTAVAAAEAVVVPKVESELGKL